MPVLGIIASQISGHLFAPSGAYDSIATVTVGAAAVVTFTSIPATYTHLQLRCLARGADAGDSHIEVRFNGDTGYNYSYHYVYGDGATVYAGAAASDAHIRLNRIAGAGTASNIFGGVVFDLLDYANTNKYKTSRALVGYDANGSGQIHFTSGNWRNTSAITSIELAAETQSNFAQYSTFALYGIKGA
jgi:hypothetical protein